MWTLYEVLHEAQTVEIRVFDEMVLSPAMMIRIRSATETEQWYKIKYGGDSN